MSHRVSLLLSATTSRKTTPLDYTAGDAQFLDALPEETCALRPVLASEVDPAMGAVGTVMVVCRSAKIGTVRTVVQVGPYRRKNTRSNILYAISKVARFNPGLAGMFKDMLYGRTPTLLSKARQGGGRKE